MPIPVSAVRSPSRSPSPSATPSSAPAVTLDYRICDVRDVEILKHMRRECGWGQERVEKYLADPDCTTFIFSNEGNDVAMGALIFESEDGSTASRNDGVIYISSLFIYRKYQGLRYGNIIMDILERICVEEHGCSVINLDTRAYQDDGGKEPSRNKLWYQRRGYVEYRNREPRWPDPSNEDSPLLVACFLRKKIDPSQAMH